MAKYYKAKISQRRKIIGAITYLLLVLVTSFAAVFFMIKFVVPMFADVYKRFGGKLPYLTSLIVNFSDWFDRHIYLMLGNNCISGSVCAGEQEKAMVQEVQCATNIAYSDNR